MLDWNELENEAKYDADGEVRHDNITYVGDVVQTEYGLSKISSNKVKILIHHPDYVALEEWNRKWKGEHEGVQSWMNKLIPSIEFEMEELEWKQLNPKLGKAA